MGDAIPPDAVLAFESDEPHRFADLSSCTTETGVYTLWDEGRLLYVGISYKDPHKTANRDAKGIRGRLSTYLNNRLDSDFALKILFRRIVPSLPQEDLADLEAGNIDLEKLRALVRKYIDERVTFRTWRCDGDTARRVESHIRRNGLGKVGQPVFNPS
jgi:hypothetical protein